MVVPARGQQQLLEDLHTAHPGIVRMKNLVRSYLWWPGLDGDIEEKVKSCQVCQFQSAAPATAPFILGSGRKSPGLGYILIILDHVWDSYF